MRGRRSRCGRRRCSPGLAGPIWTLEERVSSLEADRTRRHPPRDVHLDKVEGVSDLESKKVRDRTPLHLLEAEGNAVPLVLPAPAKGDRALLGIRSQSSDERSFQDGGRHPSQSPRDQGLVSIPHVEGNFQGRVGVHNPVPPRHLCLLSIVEADVETPGIHESVYPGNFIGLKPSIDQAVLHQAMVCLVGILPG